MSPVMLLEIWRSSLFGPTGSPEAIWPARNATHVATAIKSVKGMNRRAQERPENAVGRLMDLPLRISLENLSAANETG